jgi:hypothetical protein
MRATMMVAALLLAASTAGAAPRPRPAGGMAKGAGMQPCCPMCAQMMQGGPKMPGMSGSQPGGMMGSPMMGQMQPMMGQMQPMSGRTQGTVVPPALTVASDGTILILRGGTLYKYSADLKLLGGVHLPAAAPAAAMQMAPPAARPGG